MEEPSRVMPNTDSVEPSLMKLRKDSALPTVNMSKRESVDPSRAIPNTDKVDPKRM
jgi:hypothetical protein